MDKTTRGVELAFLIVGELLVELSHQRGRVAVIFDPVMGWCMSDDMNALKPKMGPEAPKFRVIAYKQWFQETMEDAFVRAVEIQILRNCE